MTRPSDETAGAVPMMCVAGAIKKCDDCGATLKVKLDVQLHWCNPMLYRWSLIDAADSRRHEAMSIWKLL